MSKPSPILGRDLGLAICKHFGIDITNHAVDSNFNLSTEPGKPATVTLTFMLTADDLAGIARAAGADGVQTFTASGDFCKPSQVATVTVDAETSETLRCYGVGFGRSEIAALTEDVRQLRKELNERMERYAQMHYGCAAAALGSVEAIQGEALAIDPDPRLDEIVSLLKQLVQAVERKDFLGRDMGLPVRIVAAGQ